MLPILIPLLLVTFVGWQFILLCQNYMKARKIGLPILLAPMDMYNPFWALTSSYLTPLVARLPFGLGNFTQYTGMGWTFHNGIRLHKRYGPSFIIVSPGTINIIISDPVATEEVLQRRRTWLKPAALLKPLDLFGPNVVSATGGEDWQRQRRITAPPFNERNSKLVWKESLIQATGMLNSWMAKGKEGISRTSADTVTLALHVLTCAGFGKSYPFEGGIMGVKEGYTMSYGQALRTIFGDSVRSTMLAGILPRIPTRFLSTSLAELKVAVVDFKGQMIDMIEEEKVGTETKDNLMSVLVRAAEAEAKDGKGRTSFTDEELLGNLFIYNLAGHDTTAATLAYAITFMSINPEWQSWMQEELDEVLGPLGDAEDLDCELLFPKLKRCLAVMYETLRLYGPVVWLTRTSLNPESLVIDGVPRNIPTLAYVTIDLPVLQTNPQYWGTDSSTWRPDRFLPDFSPAPGFIAWSAGPRVCPGKKFAQVEFVAALVRLFRGHRVAPVLQQGETEKQAQNRVLAEIQNSGVQATLQMNNPERVIVRWEARG